MEAFVLIIGVLIFLLYLLFWRKATPPGGNRIRRSGRGQQRAERFVPIGDNYRSLEEVSEALRKAGLESSNVIIGVDFTRSNEHQGRRMFGGRSLHTISPYQQNPYQQVISIIGKTLEPFDDDNLIPAFGFGDLHTKDRFVFPLKEGGAPCHGFAEVLECYSCVANNVTLAGPTSFAPLIAKAVEIVKAEQGFHILLIVADGQVTSERATKAAIVEASRYALSIIMVGVGDGPWDMMREFDDGLPRRAFDNFQFVDYHKVVGGARNPEVEFALNALMEVPEQFAAIRRLNLL